LIPLIIAITLWLQFLVPAPFSYLLDAIAIGYVLWKNAKGALLLVGAFVLGAFSLASNTHAEVTQLASTFQTRQATFEVIGSNRVRLLKLEECPSCSGSVGSYFGDVSPGDRLSGIALFTPARGFGEFTAKGKFTISSHKSNPVEIVRKAFLENLGGVSPEATALVAGLAIGDTSGFDDSFTAKLKTLSLTHLSAVSGANCAIVIGMVYWVLGRLRLRRVWRVSVALAVLVGYVLLVGAEPSVVRSAIMAAIVLLFVARGVWPLAALSIAASLMLVYDPTYATDYGFALSVFATGGILILTPSLAKKFESKLPKWLALTLSATVAAQLWCMPVLLSLQGGIPTYSVLANLLVEPVVAPITILGILACAIAPLVPWLATVLTWSASIPAQWIVASSNQLVELPATVLTWHTGLLGMTLCVISLSAGIYRKRFALVAVLVLLVELCFSGYELAHRVSWLPSNWEIVNCDVGQGDALVIRSEGQVALVDVGREPGPIDECLTDLGIRNIDLLMLTHFDLDHVGGLSGALRGRTVQVGVITSFKDDRPAAWATTEELSGHSVRVITGSVGTSGTLGAFNFRVLSPTPAASEAEDSNDGSIVASWSKPGLTLYTLADLGEKGQMRLPMLKHPSGTQVILKVSHHGSADQYPELIESMRPDIALISVGRDNGYGHPTNRTLKLLNSVGATVLRTDQQGMLAIASGGTGLTYSVGAGG
jgi:competence protein ComEC